MELLKSLLRRSGGKFAVDKERDVSNGHETVDTHNKRPIEMFQKDFFSTTK